MMLWQLGIQSVVICLFFPKKSLPKTVAHQVRPTSETSPMANGILLIYWGCSILANKLVKFDSFLTFPVDVIQMNCLWT